MKLREHKSAVLLVFIIGLLVGGAAAISTMAGDAAVTENDIRRNYKDSILMLTDASGRSGGTGFAVEAPSGRHFTMTNSHVCEIGHDTGILYTPVDDMGRRVQVRILEKYLFTDLCLLEPVQGKKPLKVSTMEPNEYTQLWNLGHPALRPLQIGQGHTTGKQVINILLEVSEQECNKAYMSMQEFRVWFFKVRACVATVPSDITDIIIHPGSSGSPVINNHGEVVGVMFASNSENHYGHMLPLSDVQQMLSVY